MSIYIICLVCLIVGGVLGVFMGYKNGFGAGELHSLYKGAAAAAKREEDEFLRKIERLRNLPKNTSATATLVYTVKEPNSGEERRSDKEDEQFENAKAEIYRNLNC